MCSSLASNNYDVSLIVADGNGDDCINSVSIWDVGQSSRGRLSRMTVTTRRVLNKALELNASIYHFHDPELIPVGLKLKKLGKTVIFDSHEDVEKDIHSKEYLKYKSNYAVAFLYKWFERYACSKFSAVVAATPFIRDKFLSINNRVIDVNNYPLLSEFKYDDKYWEIKEEAVVYVGGISRIRGVEEMVSAIGLTHGVQLKLAGAFLDKGVEVKVKSLSSWAKVDELGFLNRTAVNEALSKSKAGLVVLHPLVNYLDALPVKMFEYMAAGLPVIASDFPFWREIIESNSCGMCVDPQKPSDIAYAIQYLVDNTEQARVMGENGRKAIEMKFNWSIELKKLLSLYESLV
jgi:glycosyltransferase involved in cell wall biosynthesis